MKKLTVLLVTFISALSLSAAPLARHVDRLPSGPEITEADVAAAQKMWGDAVVAIGAAGDQAHKVAEDAARRAYAFDHGQIQFKPTLASEQPFRSDLEGTLSYFVAGNKKYPEDKGFALKPWTKVRFENDVVFFDGNLAIAMGHYFFTDTNGKETKVEYTKGYVKLSDGTVRIFLQDSSLPYQPPAK
ncbi:hypothetical protein [Rubellicoccus peritrichatus]|uniref:Uncharacterized protein n=1 Tax=Rubellicoccus peritrichatus TaxID=3080537 RepID=A0AAQ3QT43_9BACT|nr:hypothetical protein [Puniceicoccus sp. CR14]WOO40906.1 hypothetical protein RZN69_19970 [Puniceicoccus sp. CR14]